MDAHNRNRYAFLKFGLLALFSLYLAGISFFTHNHVVNNNRIVHSHPFKSNHDHTTAHFILIGQITHFVSHSDVIPLFDLLRKNILLTFLTCLTFSLFILKPHMDVVSLRAPPAFAA